MPRDPRLIRLSREHHHGLVMALRIQRELPHASPGDLGGLYSDLVRFWGAALQPHCEAEDEALLARLAAHEDEGLALAGRLQREHRDLEALLDGMRAATVGEDRRGAL
ncbi:MAG: hemerythrin domain-containing protein, partial [Dehalococcoidia bacterium]